MNKYSFAVSSAISCIILLSKKNSINRIFTKHEIQYCEKKAKPSEHYAARFAGKEAVIKAFYCYDIKIPLNQIEILNKKNGIPYVKILDDKIVDFKDSVDIEKLIKEAAEEYDEDNKTRVVMNGKVQKFDKDDFHMPAYIRKKGDLDEPTFLRRQAD